MTRPKALSLAAMVMSVGAGGCASVDPAPTFESTRELVEGRHPGEVRWLRDEAAVSAAAERVARLLESPLTPDAAAEVALLRNPRLQATLEELGIAQADLAQASRLSNPGVSFETLSGHGERQRTLAVTGDVVDWLVQPLRRRIAEAELERTRLEVGDALLATVAAARSAVVAHQAAQELLEHLERIEEIDRSAADFARALFEAGNLTARERASVEAAWAETRAELARARLDKVRHREAVALTLGLDAAEPWRVSGRLPPPPEDWFDAHALEEQALTDRLDLAAAHWAVDVLERATALKRKTRLFPVGVDVGVERERETDGIDLSGPTIELRLPLFDTGKASLARLSSELARARWQVRALEAAVRSSVRERAAEVDASRELVALYRDKILPLRREVLATTLLEYNQMLVGTFDLLLAKQDELAAERRAVDALAGYWLARVELERAVGSPLPAESAPAPAPDAHSHHEAAADENPPHDREENR